jgi:hypothetical protein
VRNRVWINAERLGFSARRLAFRFGCRVVQQVVQRERRHDAIERLGRKWQLLTQADGSRERRPGARRFSLCEDENGCGRSTPLA